MVMGVGVLAKKMKEDGNKFFLADVWFVMVLENHCQLGCILETV